MGIADGANHSSDVCKKSSESEEKIKIAVIGAAGRMGSSICENLKRKGYEVLAFDWTENEHKGETKIWDQYEKVDLLEMDDCFKATRGVKWVINFASFTPGLAFSESNASETMCDNNASIGKCILEAARISGVERYFQASIIFTHMGTNLCIDGCRTEPQFSNDFGNLDMELSCQNYRSIHKFESRIGRFYCLYGPLGTWHGGRGKAAGAFCLEASTSEMRAEIDALRAVRKYAKDVVRLMELDPREPEFIGILDSRELWDYGSGEIVSKKLTNKVRRTSSAPTRTKR